MSRQVPFYDKYVLRHEEQDYIQKIVSKYQSEPVTDELKAQVWEELCLEKHRGNITIPFKLVSQKDPSGKFPECIEVILDTKV